MESRYRRVVVNATGLSGKFEITLPARFDRIWPEGNKSTPVADTGLELKCEKRNVKMHVISR